MTQTETAGDNQLKPISLTDAYQAIAELARNARSKAEFYKESLRIVTSPMMSPYALVYVKLPSEIVENYCHTGETAPQFWKPLAQDVLNDTLAEPTAGMRFYTNKRNGGDIALALLAVPIRTVNGPAIGALVTVVSARDKADCRVKLALLESLVGLISCCAEYVGLEGGSEQGSQSATAKTIAKVAGFSSRHELAFSITNNLRNRLSADQVMLGLVKRNKVKIISVSGQDEVEMRSPDITIVHGAMEECLDMDETLVCQPEARDADEKASTGHRLHKQWHEASGRAAVVSIPLHVEEECKAILSIRRDAVHSFGREELQKIQELAEPYTAAISLIDRANRNILTHAVDSGRKAAHDILRPDRWLKRAMLTALVLFLGWFVFGSMTYNVSVSAKIIPAQVRHMAAPDNVTLASAQIKQGDRVSKDDVLCVFDKRDIVLERNQLISQLQMAQLEKQNAEARRSDFDARLAEANITLHQAQLKILERKLNQYTIRAPFDGLVVQGDLTERIGESLPIGEPLFEVAPDNGWKLELEIPETMAADVTGGLSGYFATRAKPDITHDLSVLEVAPQAQISKTRNVYVAKADVKMDEPWIKSGMEGVAKIEVDRRPVWWIVSHRFVNFVRLNIWL
jgi:hypothetical protein